MRRQTFVIRLWMDDQQHYWGQLGLPQSDERLPFADLAGLLALLRAQMRVSFPVDEVDQQPRDGRSRGSKSQEEK